jgi:UDP-N-acetylmuramate dehydrogenase
MTGEELRDIASEILFQGEIKYLEPMSRHTSLRIGGPAEIFAVPDDVASLASLHDYLRSNGIGLFPLGGGTNILVKDGGIGGAVVCLREVRTIEPVGDREEYVYLSVGAGTLLQRLVMQSRVQGYAGIEGLAGIPGTIGGAISGNSGSFGYEIKDVLVSVDLMDARGQVQTVRAEDIAFGYRKSGIPRDSLILSAEIKLRKDNREEVSARIEHFLKVKRERQPVWESSAGCVFRNPEGLSAGKLIEDAGCKGMRVHDVAVSSIHANFFVNEGNATAADFISLMQEVAGMVNRRFGIALEPEIRIVGRDDANG